MRGGGNGSPPPLLSPGTSPTAGTPLQGVQERIQELLTAAAERGKPVPRLLALPVVGQDGLLECRGAAVVQVCGELSQTPQRRRAHELTGRVVLCNAVAERAHVVEQEVRVGMDQLAVESG